MNIFVLSPCPVESAKLLDNRRVIKMILESVQLLSTSINMLGGKGPYKSTHVNHPCTVWTRTSKSNAEWLIKHLESLCAEYTKRYNKVHKCVEYIPTLKSNINIIPDIGLTPFENCTKFKEIDDVFLAYQLALNDKWEQDSIKGYEPRWE